MNPPVRVLHLGKYYPPVTGGMETFCGDLQRAFLRRDDIESRMLVHRKPGMGPPADQGVTAVATRGELFFTPLARGLRKALRRQIEDFRPQVLHCHLPNPAAFVALSLGAARRLPWVLHWQSDVVASAHEWRLRLAWPFYRPLERLTLRQARAVIATSPDYAAASPALQGLDKVVVLPLGIDPARIATAGPAPEWPADGLRILAVGRLTYYKGFDVLLDALAGVPDCSALILGDGQRRQPLLERVRRLGLGHRVRFVHDADDATRNAALRAADCLCLPSIERTEAFGLVLLEAMAAGLPVVATRIAGSGVPWVVEQGGHGLLAEALDPGSLAHCLGRLAGSPALREDLAAAARSNFGRFHIDQVATALVDLYRQSIPA